MVLKVAAAPSNSFSRSFSFSRSRSFSRLTSLSLSVSFIGEIFFAFFSANPRSSVFLARPFLPTVFFSSEARVDVIELTTSAGGTSDTCFLGVAPLPVVVSGSNSTSLNS